MPRFLRHLHNAALFGGLGLIAAGVLAACGGSGASDATPTSIATSEPSSTPTSSPTATATATPTATPTPFAGPLASIEIPALNVKSVIQPAGVTADNYMETPKDHHTTFWYDPAKTGWDDGTSRPGWGGNAVMSAHHSYNLQAGPFRHIADLEIGDTVTVTMENGLAYTYEVFRVERYPEATFPTGELIWPAEKPANEEWLTLITCGGTLVVTNPDRGTGYFQDRDVVVAKRVL